MNQEDVYIYTMKYYSVWMMKEWNNAIYSNMDGPGDYHSKWSKSEKDKHHICLHAELKKKSDTNKFTYKIKTDSEI